MSHAKASANTAVPGPGTPERCALVVTALRVEFNAVCGFLSNRQEHLLSHGAICEVGRFQEAGANWIVAVLEIGPGNERAASETTAAMLGLNPDIALFVGVAGGLKDVVLGDVVAATKVYGYESGKDAASFRPRPEVFRSSYLLEQRAKAVSRNAAWSVNLGSVGDGSRQPKSFVAPIAAGSKVVASRRSPIFRLLQQNYGDALAVEMEGLGFLVAAFPHADVQALVVRGISDLISGKAKAERHGSHEIAAKNAAAFAFAVLAEFQSPDNSRASRGLNGRHVTKSSTTEEGIEPKKFDERPPDEESIEDQARRQENDEETDAPASCKTRKSSFKYSDQHIWIDTILPNVEHYFGSCATGFKQTGLNDCIMTQNHQDILSTLTHGHHSGVEVEKRRIIAFGPSEGFDKYAIDIGNARLFLSEVAARSLCSATDALHEAYLEALKRIDSAWEADGFSYENRESGAVVVRLGTLSTRMWSHIVEFAEEHDFEHGDSEWHMFDANDMSLVIYSPTPTRRFDKGMHVHVSATHQSPASTSTADTITLLWNPPSRYRREIYPLSERRYWGAATTFRWINEELIPKIYEWIWSNKPLRERLSPRAEQHKTELYSRLKDYGVLVNYERQRRQSMDLHGSLPDLQRLVATLQEEFHGASDAEYILKKEMMSNLYHTIILCLPHVDPENLDYVARKLDLPDVQDKEELIEKLKEKIKQDDFPCNLYPVELALRSLLFLLQSQEVFLNAHEMKQIVSYLNPLIEIYHEVDMRRRHGLE